MDPRRTLQTMEGLDASRRVGWAKYYEIEQALEEVKETLAQLARAVRFHPRIHSDDEILELAREALKKSA